MDVELTIKIKAKFWESLKDVKQHEHGWKWSWNIIFDVLVWSNHNHKEPQQIFSNLQEFSGKLCENEMSQRFTGNCLFVYFWNYSFLKHLFTKIKNKISEVLRNIFFKLYCLFPFLFYSLLISSNVILKQIESTRRLFLLLLSHECCDIFILISYMILF